MNKLAVLLVLAACGDNIKGPPDLGPDAAVAPWAEAVPSSMPQLVTLGGDVLAQPKIQPIFFANDPLQAQVETFLAKLASSSYWIKAATEYGVGTPSVLPTIVTNAAPPVNDTDLDAWFKAQFPTADPNTIYTLFLGDGMVLHGQGGDSCSAYGAFHDEGTDAHGGSLVYALMPRCDPSTAFDHAQNKLDELTISTSHELLEASTDPRVETTPAYGDIDDDHAILALVPGAEVGDLCEYLDSAYIRGVGEFMVQRTWSNAAAAAGHDPCVPAPATTYFAAAPMFTEAVSIDGFTGSRTTKAMKLPVGTSKTIDVDLFSDTPMSEDFTIDALDSAEMYGDPAELTFAWDTDTGKNGDKLHLTITRARAAAQGAPGSIFVLSTKSATGLVSQWWGYVSN
jgi:predicted small lipoprotein YifL